MLIIALHWSAPVGTIEIPSIHVGISVSLPLSHFSSNHYIHNHWALQCEVTVMLIWFSASDFLLPETKSHLRQGTFLHPIGSCTYCILLRTCLLMFSSAVTKSPELMQFWVLCHFSCSSICLSRAWHQGFWQLVHRTNSIEFVLVRMTHWLVCHHKMCILHSRA